MPRDASPMGQKRPNAKSATKPSSIGNALNSICTRQQQQSPSVNAIKCAWNAMKCMPLNHKQPKAALGTSVGSDTAGAVAVG
jgi:hypothetical protein